MSRWQSRIKNYRTFSKFPIRDFLPTLRIRCLAVALMQESIPSVDCHTDRARRSVDYIKMENLVFMVQVAFFTIHGHQKRNLKGNRMRNRKRNQKRKKIDLLSTNVNSIDQMLRTKSVQ